MTSQRLKFLSDKRSYKISNLNIDMQPSFEPPDQNNSKNFQLANGSGPSPKFNADDTRHNVAVERSNGRSLMKSTFNGVNPLTLKPKLNLLPFPKSPYLSEKPSRGYIGLDIERQVTGNGAEQAADNMEGLELDDNSNRSQHKPNFDSPNSYHQAQDLLNQNKYSPNELYTMEQSVQKNEYQPSYGKAIAFLKDNRSNYLPKGSQSKTPADNDNLKLDLYKVGLPQSEKKASDRPQNVPSYRLQNVPSYRSELYGYGNSNRNLTPNTLRRDNDSNRDPNNDAGTRPMDYFKYVNDDIQINKLESQRSDFSNNDERILPRRYNGQKSIRSGETQMTAFNNLSGVVNQIKSKRVPLELRQPQIKDKNDAVGVRRVQNYTPIKNRGGFEAAAKAGSDTTDSPSMQNAYKLPIFPKVSSTIDSPQNSNNSRGILNDGYRQLKLMYDDRQRKTPSPLRVAHFDLDQSESKNFQHSFYRV